MPITAVSVFGMAGLIVLTVGVIIVLGLRTDIAAAREHVMTRSTGLINALEEGVRRELRPLATNGRRIAEHVVENEDALRDLASFDAYMSGVLSTSTGVAGIAIVRADGMSRRWAPNDAMSPVTEDWSSRSTIVEWLADGKTRASSEWAEPFWTPTIDDVVLLHDTPIRAQDGRFLGMIGQIVTIARLSHTLSSEVSELGITPFVLYDKTRVLAHPVLIGLNTLGSPNENASTLPMLGDVGDGVLERIWFDDNDQPLFLRDTDGLQTSGALFGDNFYIFLYRDIEGFGPKQWTVGAHVNTEVQEDSQVRRVVQSALGGLLVLVLAVAFAIWLGRRVSRPVQAFADAARLVETRQFDEVPKLHPSRVREIDDAARSFNGMVDDLRERELIRETLGRFVPEEVARTLLSEGGSLAPEQTQATVLYSDLENFTGLTERIGAAATVEMLNAYFSAMVDILQRFGGVATQFQGDAILATFNVPITNKHHALNAIKAAMEMIDTVDEKRFANQRVNVRIGINTGTVIAGAVGAAGRMSYTVHGDAVNLAARLEEMNKEYKTRILISQHSVNEVSEIDLRAVGEAPVRGQGHSVELYTPAEHVKP